VDASPYVHSARASCGGVPLGQKLSILLKRPLWSRWAGHLNTSNTSALCCGLDFVIHLLLGHAYSHLPGDVDRGRRTKYTWIKMGGTFALGNDHDDNTISRHHAVCYRDDSLLPKVALILHASPHNPNDMTPEEEVNLLNQLLSFLAPNEGQSMMCTVPTLSWNKSKWPRKI
jgi:hypothetical protein